MTSDRIVSQRWGIFCLSGDLAVRNQSQLDQSLESVTDSKCQSVLFIQKFFYCFFNLRILECCRKEFCRSVRFISGTESTRNIMI